MAAKRHHRCQRTNATSAPGTDRKASDLTDSNTRARELYEEGARLLAAGWDDELALVAQEAHGQVRHPSRAALAYACVLVRAGGADDVARAERIIGAAAQMQETREDDAHFGNFRWNYEDPCVIDLNAVEFVLDAVNELVRTGASKLSDDAMSALRRMLELGLAEIDRLDVQPSYTNIALSDICNSVLGGEALGDDAYVERGRRRLDEWLEFTARSGAPHEFNSPTYLAVDLNRLAFLSEETRDSDIALRARIAEERVWVHAAAHYHPRLAQLAGPHSRSYGDGWTGGSGYLKLLLWRLLGHDSLRRDPPWYPQGREEGHTGIATHAYHVPAYVGRALEKKRYPYECVETVDTARGLDITSYMAETFTLGTSSRAYACGDPPEAWSADNAFLLHFDRGDHPAGVVLSRYLVNDRAPRGDEFREEGTHVAAQSRNRAIVAYGLQPRIRPAHSFKLAVMAYGVDDAREVWCGDRRVDAFPHPVEPGAPIVIDGGGAHIALIPLEPSDMGHGAGIELTRDGELLTLNIENYRGPDKSFWEHRTQSGAFFKGHVRNAFIVEAGSPPLHGSFAAFRAHIDAARISDSVDDAYVREIAYASEGGSVSLRYSLWDMRIIERRAGHAIDVPMGRGGAIDGSGMQWRQSRDSLVELNGATLLAGRAPKWLAADRDNGNYIFVNPSDEEAPLWFETPSVVVECDAFAFGRVEIDERAGTVAVAASGEIGAVRVRGAQRLMLNGTDVTASMTGPDDAGVREFAGLGERS